MSVNGFLVGGYGWCSAKMVRGKCDVFVFVIVPHIVGLLVTLRGCLNKVCCLSAILNAFGNILADVTFVWLHNLINVCLCCN